MKLLGFTPPSPRFAMIKLGDSVYCETVEHGVMPGIVIGKDVRFYYPYDKPHEILTVKTFTHTEGMLLCRTRAMFLFPNRKGGKR